MLLRMKIVLDMGDKFDYNLFVEKCKVSNIAPLTLGEYSQKIGMLTMAIRLFPDDSPRDAYLRFVAVMNKEYQQTSEAIEKAKQLSIKTSCGSCGGGKVR